MTDEPGGPGLPAVIALLYRADWRRLSLSGQVRGRDESLGAVPGDAGRRVTLHVAPGGRYRRDAGAFIAGSDGGRAWQWRPDQAGENESRWTPATVPPYWPLLCPSWLLTEYELRVRGPYMVCGRTGIRVTGTVRGPVRPIRLGPIGADPSIIANRFRRVEAVIDPELGILLRYRGTASERDRKAPVVEFTRLSVPGEAAGALFEPPPGSSVTTARQPQRGPTRHWGLPREALDFLGPAKTAAGLAAGGLGAALRYTPLGLLARYPDADNEPMPDDDPQPLASAADEAPVSEEALSLLYHSGATVPRFTATLHSWVSTAMLAGIPESWRQTGLGGVGFLADTLGQGPGRPHTTHTVSTARIDGWDKYRIEHQLRGRKHVIDPVLAAGCDGQRSWELHEDRVSVGDRRTAPADLADLADPSWLLGCELSGGDLVTADGRPAYRLAVRGRWSNSSLLMFGSPAIAVLDAQAGRLLRLTCYSNGQPAMRHELRDVTLTAAAAGPAGPAGNEDLTYSAPTGLRVVDAHSPADRPPPSAMAAKVAGSMADTAAQAADDVRRQAGETIAAARNLLGSLGNRRRPRLSRDAPPRQPPAPSAGLRYFVTTSCFFAEVAGW